MALDERDRCHGGVASGIVFDRPGELAGAWNLIHLPGERVRALADEGRGACQPAIFGYCQASWQRADGLDCGLSFG
jgi:hypothetical protein